MEKREKFLPIVLLFIVFTWMITSVTDEGFFPLWLDFIVKTFIFILVAKYVWKGRDYIA